MTDRPFRAGFLVFPGLTQLDLTGPFEVIAAIPGCEAFLVWKSREPVVSASGLVLVPTATFADRPPIDLLCVPGGPGADDLMADTQTLEFLRQAAGEARYVTSVCTGSLLLGAAGLLRGRRAACHWMSRELLALFGAEPVAERVVIDGTLITGGGVTAGIDFAFRVVEQVAGRAVAERIQLLFEYDPDPPFATGSPRAAGAALVEEVRSRGAARMATRTAKAEAAAKALSRP